MHCYPWILSRLRNTPFLLFSYRAHYLIITNVFVALIKKKNFRYVNLDNNYFIHNYSTHKKFLTSISEIWRDIIILNILFI